MILREVVAVKPREVEVYVCEQCGVRYVAEELSGPNEAFLPPGWLRVEEHVEQLQRWGFFHERACLRAFMAGEPLGPVRVDPLEPVIVPRLLPGT